MKKITLLLTIALILGFSAQVFAYHVGDAITSLKPFYGASWDSNAELWQVLDDAGFDALAADVQADLNSGSPSGNYHVYENSFWQTSYGPYQLELIAEVAGYAPNNRFGWYEKDDTGWGELFEGSDSNVSGNTASFSNSNEVGFWLNANGGAEYYYTDNSLNSGDDLQAVTFYLGDYAGYGNEYLICFEDLDYSGCCDRDFQDMIVLLQDPVPEPATLSLLGMGLLGFIYSKKKRR